MKNKRFLAGILGFTLVFGLIFIGCPMDSDDEGGKMPTKFEGTWKHIMPEAQNATFTFTNQNVTYQKDNLARVYGTFAFDDTTLTISFTNGDTRVYAYSLVESTLTLESISGDYQKYFHGQFHKQ
jgi:hypothetical protein